jgi:hypothetical protein
VRDVGGRARREVVDDGDVIAAFDESLGKMGSDEAGSSCDQIAHGGSAAPDAGETYCEARPRGRLRVEDSLAGRGNPSHTHLLESAKHATQQRVLDACIRRDSSVSSRRSRAAPPAARGALPRWDVSVTLEKVRLINS